MSGSAIVMAVIGVVVIWGGLIASIIKARMVAKERAK